MYQIFLVAFAATSSAFPFVADAPGVDSSLLGKRIPGDEASCPFNPDHVNAQEITTQYPYCGAKNLVPGKQACTNKQGHSWTCPGLNTAANHNFLARDGITTFTELVDMQQNVYGVGYDLAVLLATLGVGLDGDPITQKLSISCDATSRTATPGLGPEPGLVGHNKFEGDTSLSRNDYFLAGGDNFSFNGTLYAAMSAVARGNFSVDQLSLYRYGRYLQSRNDNGNFYFGPKSLLLFGAASFLYELFPSKGDKGPADQATMDLFFGATRSGRTYVFNNKERLPNNWFSRETPYTIRDVGAEIRTQYFKYPVAFGGNAGRGNFVGIGPNGAFLGQDGKFNGTSQDVTCLLYQFATENVPSSIQGRSNVPIDMLRWMAGKVNPVYQNEYPCPLNFL